MKHLGLLFCVLLVATIAVPAAAAGAELPVTTEPVIIHGVTREQTAETTKAPTAAPAGPQVGWVTIISTPSGASVTIDSRSAGVTPITGTELGSGISHTIRITLAGYVAYETQVRISPGEQTAIDAELVPVPAPEPTKAPTTEPTRVPTTEPTRVPTKEPTAIPTSVETPIGGDKGWIRVNCNVDGATVSFDQLSGGCIIARGSCNTEVGTTSTPFKTFTVQKPGYETFNGQVTVWPGRGETVNLFATLNPVPSPSYGSIQVISYPAGAVATLDGISWQYTPATFTSVTAGSNHIIQISMSSYQPYTSAVYVTAGQSTVVNIDMIPNPPQPYTGSLKIDTTPKGADIYVDGRYMVSSPGIIPGLAPGSHMLRLHKAGYDEYIGAVTISAGRTTPFSFILGYQRPDVGSIEVASTPSGASLYLDGNFMGTTTAGDYFDLTSLSPGYHTILLRQRDYQDYTQSVFVAGGGVVTIIARLTPAVPGPTPDTTGQILVTSVPAGAELFLDNTFMGVTPATLPDIPAGSHIIILMQAGYPDYMQTVTVTGGQTTPVAAVLTAIPVTTRKKSPMAVAPVVGAIMVIGAIVVLRRK